MSRVLPLSLGLLLLAGCAARVPLQEPGSPAQRVAALEAIENWTADGRIAVSDGRRSWQAGVHWQQRGERYAIDLIGPLGQGRLDIRGGPDGVVLRDGERTLRADDPDTLLADAGGVPVPVGGLRYWLRGLPEPDQPARPVTDAGGRLTRLTQDGWQIVYPNYVTVDGLALPQRIQASREAFEVKVLVDRWTLD